MATFKYEDVPVLVLHFWAWKIQSLTLKQAKKQFWCKYRNTHLEPEVVKAKTRAAYRWAETVPEEIYEELLAEYRNCHTVRPEESEAKAPPVPCYSKEYAYG